MVPIKIIMIYKDKIAFDDWTITNSEYDFLYALAKANNAKSVLEFGTGASTCSFLEHGCRVTSFETSARYIDLRYPYLRTDSNCSLIFYEIGKHPFGLISLGEKFDLAFIDGPNGTKNLSRLDSCLFALKYTDHIFLHDFRRSGERETFAYIIEQYPEWKTATLKTDREIGYLYRGNKLLIPEYI